MIQINDLTLKIPGRTLVANLNLRIERGQRWCVIGKNGSGKSTLLRSIAGLQPVDKLSQGEIFWDGELISQIDTFKLASTRDAPDLPPPARLAASWLAANS